MTAVNLGSFGVPTVRGVGMVALQRSPWLKNGLRDSKELAAAIKQALETAQPHPINLKQAAVSLPETAVFTKTLTLPLLSKKELAQTIPYEAAEILPLPLEEVYLDWHLDQKRPAPEPGEKPTMRVLVVAAPKKTIDDLTEIMTSIGLAMVNVESEPFALVRSLRPSLSAKAYQLICSIRQENATIAIANREHVVLTSTLLTGRKKIRANPKTEIQRLIQEIKSTIMYYQSRLSDHEEIQTILVTGEGATIPELTEAIERGTNITCKIGRPLIRLPHNAAVHPRYTAAFGTALWSKTT